VYRNYDGDVLPETEIGIIEVTRYEGTIYYIDGKSFNRGLGIKRYELTPGERELVIVKYPLQDVVTYFDVEAGKKYEFISISNPYKAKEIFGVDVFNGGRWYVLVREQGTNTIVNYPEPRQ
jgi:hypothetical protein